MRCSSTTRSGESSVAGPEGTPQHEAPSSDGVYTVVTFNPAGNRNQVSHLLLWNRGTGDARVTITGTDDTGASPGETVSLVLPAGKTRSLSAEELESGGNDFAGGIGVGRGKWRLAVESDRPILVMSLLESPTGHLTNLSSVPQ